MTTHEMKNIDIPIPAAQMLDESPNAWLLTDAEGRIYFANQRATVLFGYSREELLAGNIEMLVPEHVRTRHPAYRESYMEHPTVRPMGAGMELSARRKDGSEVPVDISLSPMESPEGTYVTVIVRDISTRLRLEDERNRLRLELEMERERDRIGMELHDGIMQEIYATGLTLELALADVRDRPEGAEDEIERSIEQLHRVIRNVRSYIFDLRPREYAGTLSSALRDLVREFKENSDIDVVEDVPDLDAEVPETAAIAAYRIAHEALSNVRTHAEATKVAMAVTQATNGDVMIEVSDNGFGYGPSDAAPQAHRALGNMEARARNAGLELEVESEAGTGTRVLIRVPTGAPGA